MHSLSSVRELESPDVFAISAVHRPSEKHCCLAVCPDSRCCPSAARRVQRVIAVPGV